MIMWQGLAITMPPDDHFRRKLEEMKSIGMLWADNAKKVQTLLVYLHLYAIILEVLHVFFIGDDVFPYTGSSRFWGAWIARSL